MLFSWLILLVHLIVDSVWMQPWSLIKAVRSVFLAWLARSPRYIMKFSLVFFYGRSVVRAVSILQSVHFFIQCWLIAPRLLHLIGNSWWNINYLIRARHTVLSGEKPLSFVLDILHVGFYSEQLLLRISILLILNIHTKHKQWGRYFLTGCDGLALWVRIHNWEGRSFDVY